MPVSATPTPPIHGHGYEPETPAKASPGRFRRAVARVAAAVGLGVVFTAATVAGAVVHLNLRPTRELARRIVNDVLASALQGDVVIERVDYLGLRRIAVGPVVVRHPKGDQVLWATDVQARFDALAILREVVLGDGDMALRIPYVRVGHADVSLDQGEVDALKLIEAFTPEPSPEEEDDEPGRPVRLELSRVLLDGAWAHGVFAPPQAVDASVEDVSASIVIGDEESRFVLERARLTERRLLPAPITVRRAHATLVTGEQTPLDMGFGAKGAARRPGAPNVELEAEVDGRVGDVALSARGTLRDEHLSAYVEVPRATPGALAEVQPGLPIHRPLSVEATAEGLLSKLDVEARVRVLAPEHGRGPQEGGEILATARLNVLEPRQIAARVRVERLDPRAFAPGAPAMRASGQAQATITLGEGLPRVVAAAQTAPTVVEGQLVPATEVRAIFEGGRLRGAATIHEKGAPIQAEVAYSEQEGLRFQARSEIPALDRVPRLEGLGLRGRASIHAAGTLRDEGEGAAKAGSRPMSLDAAVEARLEGFAVGERVELAQAALHAKVAGPIDAPKLDAHLRGEGLRAERFAFERVAVDATGPAASPHVEVDLGGGERRVAAAADLDFGRSEARWIRVEVARGADTVAGQIQRAGWARGLEVEGLALGGTAVGSLEGALSLRGERLEADLRGADIDLGRIVDIAGIPVDLGGLANVDVSLHGDGRRRKGHVMIELENGVVPGLVPLVSANVTARLEGEDIQADGLVRLVMPADVARRRRELPDGPAMRELRAMAEEMYEDRKLRLPRPEPEPRVERRPEPEPTPAAMLAAQEGERARRGAPACGGVVARVLLERGRARVRGSLFEARTWQTATGAARLVAGSESLGCLARLAPEPLPLSEVAGIVTARVDVARGAGERFPSVRDFLVRTQGLRVAGPADERTGAPSWSSGAIDVRAAGGLDGDTGEARVTLSVLDRQVLAELSATADLDLPALLGRPAALRAVLEKTPVTAHLSIPRRRLDDVASLPPTVRASLPDIAGAAQLDAYVAGTLADPRIVARSIGWKIGPGVLRGPQGAAGGGLDFDTLLVYDGRNAQLDAYALRGGRRLLTATAKVRADIVDLLDQTPGRELPWGGSLEAKLDDFPLASVPVLADMGFGGSVRGEIAVRDLFDAPSVTARIEIPGLQVGPGGFFETAEASLDITPPGAAEPSVARAKLTLAAHDGGRIDAEARTHIAWKAGALPQLTEDRAADVSLVVRRFRLATIEPLLGDAVDRLDGYLDGDVRLGLGEHAGFTGEMRLTDGVFQVPAIGQAFENATLHVEAMPSGELRIRDVAAEAVGGRVEGHAVVRMKGLELQSARAELAIPKGREIPLALEGVPLGKARGRVVASVENRKDALAFEVTVPELRLDLPPTVGRSVQPLDEHDDVITSAPLSREELEQRLKPEGEPQDTGKPLVAVIRLGDIRLGGEMLSASITGDPARPLRIELAGGETEVSGDIRILSGKLEVLGKEFVIEPSLVHLSGEPSNPYLNVTAWHDTPQGNRIYIDYVGQLQPITDDKIKFRSDPPRPEEEVLAQLLFGTQLDNGTLAGGGSTAESSGTGSTVGGAAAGVGTGLASAQINAILQSIGPLQHFETKLGTTEEGAMEASLGYELGERVTASASYAAGEERPAGGASHSRAGKTEVSIEWRFVREWFLRAAIGSGESTSTSVDLLWQHRY